MVAPVRFEPLDENDIAAPAREITSRHRLDRRSLLPPRRVMPLKECHQPHPQRLLTRCRPWTNRGCACQRAAVLDHDAAPTVGLSRATSPTGSRTEVSEGKTRGGAGWDRTLSVRQILVKGTCRWRGKLRSTHPLVSDELLDPELTGNICETRPVISAAARSERVINRIRLGSAPLRMRYATRELGYWFCQIPHRR